MKLSAEQRTRLRVLARVGRWTIILGAGGIVLWLVAQAVTALRLGLDPEYAQAAAIRDTVIAVSAQQTVTARGVAAMTAGPASGGLLPVVLGLAAFGIVGFAAAVGGWLLLTELRLDLRDKRDFVQPNINGQLPVLRSVLTAYPQTALAANAGAQRVRLFYGTPATAGSHRRLLEAVEVPPAGDQPSAAPADPFVMPTFSQLIGDGFLRRAELFQGMTAAGVPIFKPYEESHSVVIFGAGGSGGTNTQAIDALVVALASHEQQAEAGRWIVIDPHTQHTSESLTARLAGLDCLLDPNIGIAATPADVERALLYAREQTIGRITGELDRRAKCTLLLDEADVFWTDAAYRHLAPLAMDVLTLINGQGRKWGVSLVARPHATEAAAFGGRTPARRSFTTTKIHKLAWDQANRHLGVPVAMARTVDTLPPGQMLFMGRGAPTFLTVPLLDGDAVQAVTDIVRRRNTYSRSFAVGETAALVAPPPAVDSAPRVDIIADVPDVATVLEGSWNDVGEVVRRLQMQPPALAGKDLAPSVQEAVAFAMLLADPKVSPTKQIATIWGHATGSEFAGRMAIVTAWRAAWATTGPPALPPLALLM